MAALATVFGAVRNYSGVIVTGPQRSGTRIGAHILAELMGYRYVDEEEFGIHDYTRALEILKGGKVVIQAPALCHVAHLMGFPVVMMRRSLEEIRKSEERVGWRTAYGGANLAVELSKYKFGFGWAGGANIAEIKYFAWDNFQKQHCEAAVDLDYSALATHPLWVEAKERELFKPHQWQPEREKEHA